MTLGEIVKGYRETHKISMGTFANRAGVSKAYISMIENNRHPKSGKPVAPSLKVLSRLADAMNCDLDDLLSQYRGDVTISIDETVKGAKIPVLGKVAAGIPLEAIEDIYDYEEIPEALARRGVFFGLVIRGDSMSPQLEDGDVVIVRQQEDAESGETVIATVNGNDACCKRLMKFAGGVQLLSNNPSYEPMMFTEEQIKTLPVVILGKVVESRRKF